MRTESEGCHIFYKRCVMFLTTYASALPSIEKQKYDSKERKIPIQVTAIVDVYNPHMGGEDGLGCFAAADLCLLNFKTEIAEAFRKQEKPVRKG